MQDYHKIAYSTKTFQPPKTIFLAAETFMVRNKSNSQLKHSDIQHNPTKSIPTPVTANI